MTTVHEAVAREIVHDCAARCTRRGLNLNDMTTILIEALAAHLARTAVDASESAGRPFVLLPNPPDVAARVRVWAEKLQGFAPDIEPAEPHNDNDTAASSAEIG